MSIYRERPVRTNHASVQLAVIKKDSFDNYIQIKVVLKDGSSHTIALDEAEQSQFLAVRRRIKKTLYKSATQQKLNSKKMPGTK